MTTFAQRIAHRSSAHLLAACALLFPPSVHSAETSFHWPGWKIPGQAIEDKGALTIVVDEDAESAREAAGEDGKPVEEHVALMQRVSRRMVAKTRNTVIASTPGLPRKDVAPGVYRISARISFDGETGLIGTPIQLALENAPSRGAVREYAPCDFEEAGPYYVLSLLYEVAPGDDKRLAARAARHTARAASFYYDAYPNAERPETETPRDPGNYHVTVSLPQTRYSSFSGMPPNSLRWVRVDWVKMERVDPSPSITVRHVRPRKLWLRPGEESGFDTALENFSTSARKRRLEISLVRGFDEKTVIHTEDVELAAGEARTVSIPWRTTGETALWGYEVRAEILDGETVESHARDYFQVHPECYAVHVSGSQTRHVDPFRHPETHQNHVEIFGVTPGDCARIMPQRDRWVVGMLGGGGIQTFKLINAAVDHNTEHGIATFMYLFAGGTGTALMDMCVEHPEWVAGRAVATDVIYRMRRQREQYVWDYDFEKAPPEWHEKVPHVEQGLNHCFPGLKGKIENEALAFVEATGFQGIRFDVGIFGPRGNRTVLGTTIDFDMSTAQEHAARNFNDFKDRLRAKYPGFEFGANMDTWAYLEQVGNRKVTPKPPEEYPEFVAFCRAHGMLMDEGSMSAPLFDHYMNRWEDAFWGMCRKRDIAAKYGGIYELFSPHRNGTGHFAHDDIYWAIITVASGSHYVGNYAAPPYSTSSVGAFVTRFSEFFWDTSLDPLEDAADKVYVDAPSDVWFADATRRIELAGRLRYVIPLINPPVSERLRRNKINELPPSIDEPFNVEVTMPDGYGAAEAWMLTWEPDVAAVRLDAKRSGNTLTVQFPELKLFRTLVVEFVEQK